MVNLLAQLKLFVVSDLFSYLMLKKSKLGDGIVKRDKHNKVTVVL